MRFAIVAMLALVCAVSNAEARQRHRHQVAQCVETGTVLHQVCGMNYSKVSGGYRVPDKLTKADRRESRRLARGQELYDAMPFGMPTDRAGRVLGGRPAGCPHRFCGCGASLYRFGRIIPSLNLAANWLRFRHVPLAMAQPKMAAARRGHVMILERQLSGNVWLVHDSNSGGGRTRLHARSIAGFTIVDPSGAV
jgi:hypothetical protein